MTIYDSDDPVDDSRYAELVQRLNAMRWPEASPEARRRCWEAVQRDLAAANGVDVTATEEEAPVQGPALVWDGPAQTSYEARPRRHEFVTRGGGYTGALGGRVAVARGPMRIPAGVR